MIIAYKLVAIDDQGNEAEVFRAPSAEEQACQTTEDAIFRFNNVQWDETFTMEEDGDESQADEDRRIYMDAELEQLGIGRLFR